jgi:hypothetical protein
LLVQGNQHDLFSPIDLSGRAPQRASPAPLRAPSEASCATTAFSVSSLATSVRRTSRAKNHGNRRLSI